MTVREALTEGKNALQAADVESASLDAALLLAEVLHRGRSFLAAAGPEPLAEDALAAFRALVKRRQSGECVAYLLGRKEFHGLDFKVGPAVLVPRPDTETLVEAALEFARNKPECRVLDLCTGSGAVAVSLKHEMPNLNVWASDISAEALEIARTNAALLLEEGHPASGNAITFLQGDLFAALGSPPVRFSLIISNAPYIPSAQIKSLSKEVQNEPTLALDGGGDGLAIIRRIIAGAPDFLLSGGALFLEADPRQMESIVALLTEQGFINIKTHTDLSGRPRVIAGTKPGNNNGKKDGRV